MHDIDRTQFEADELTSGYGGELEQQPQSELPLNETEELELASGLLEVADEMELEAFLGDVFRAVGRAAGQFARSDAGKALGGILKNTIGQALPGMGGAAPGAGLAQQAGSLLGLELEGLSAEDQEFETARQLVRFASSAYRNAAWAPRHVSAPAIARAASLAAARRYAPGLLRTRDHRRGGSWQSRGYSSAPRSGYGYGYGARRYHQPTGYQPSGYQPTGYQPAPYWGRRRRPRQPTYGQPWYPRGYWAAAPEPEPEPAPPLEPPPPPPPPPPLAEPPAAMAEPALPPGAAEPPPAAAAPSSSELEAMGMNGSRRGGRWVRRDGVLIVYGA